MQGTKVKIRKSMLFDSHDFSLKLSENRRRELPGSEAAHFHTPRTASHKALCPRSPRSLRLPKAPVTLTSAHFRKILAEDNIYIQSAFEG